MIRSKSLVMLFSDLLADPEPVMKPCTICGIAATMSSCSTFSTRPRCTFPFEGLIEFEDAETPDRLTLDAQGMREDYLEAVEEFRETYRSECAKANIDYVPMDTSISFDKALMEYLVQRQRRF